MSIWVAAAVGNYFYVWLKKRLDLRTKTVLLINLAVFALINLYGSIGLIPNLPFGFKSSPEMYTYAAIYGFHIGAVQSFQRALFADFTIPGRETEFFSLYAITDRGSSWLGPLVVGIIRNFTGSLRGGFVYILLMIVLPSLGLAFFVDHDQGLTDRVRAKLPPCPMIDYRIPEDSIAKLGSSAAVVTIIATLIHCHPLVLLTFNH
ncbi:Autophagy protein 22 [Perkinsus olseni]|uniref:Autophagy protein 22 n=1 Tax=Perkinsus olseni TaxID=32597 RepID=A0A7J6SWS3_PEROL|nr:Autophagy protein 22 [Perkinsus olseni]